MFRFDCNYWLNFDGFLFIILDLWFEHINFNWTHYLGLFNFDLNHRRNDCFDWTHYLRGFDHRRHDCLDWTFYFLDFCFDFNRLRLNFDS